MSDEVIESLENTPEVMAVLPLARPFIAALARENNKGLTDQFIATVAKKNWADVDKLMWQFMTEDERDVLSNEVLASARAAVDNMHLAEKFFKEVLIKVVFYLLKII